MNASSVQLKIVPAETTKSLVQRVADIAPIIAERARETEKAGSVPDENIQLLRSIGYFDIVKPAQFGGNPGHFSELVAANIAVSAACASTGWVAGLTAAHQWFLAMLPLKAQEDVWGQNPDALLCGSYAPTTMAKRVDGGYVLDGHWAFASGCENAQWALCAVVLPRGRRQKTCTGFHLGAAERLHQG